MGIYRRAPHIRLTRTQTIGCPGSNVHISRYAALTSVLAFASVVLIQSIAGPRIAQGAVLRRAQTAGPVISSVAYLPNVGSTDVSITWSTLNEDSDTYC